MIFRRIKRWQRYACGRREEGNRESNIKVVHLRNGGIVDNAMFDS